MGTRSQAVSEPPGGACSSASVASLLEVIASLEKLKAQVEGLQAILEVEHRRRSVHAQREAGVRREHLGRGVAEEIGLTRGISAKRAGDQLAVRRVLVESLPQTVAKVLAGEVQVWPAEQIAQVAIVLDDDDRARLDAEVAGRIAGWSPSSVKGCARRIADRLDQEAAVRRLRRVESQRHVSIRPVADGMVRLSALLPTTAGVATFASLTKHAAAARAHGDARSKGQLMADALVERITGVADPAESPVEIQLLMTDRTLLAGGSDPALLEGHAVPAEVARALALCTETSPGTPWGTSAIGGDVETAVDAAPSDHMGAAPLRYLRRLFTDPVSGSLTDMDQRRRGFTRAVRTFIRARDQRCRIPHCHAPIRDIDHVTRHADGGATSIENGVGLCQRHNLAKEIPGWSARIDAHAENGRAGMLVMRTPSGTEHLSPAPDLHALTGPPLGARGHRPADAGPPPPRLHQERRIDTAPGPDEPDEPDELGRADDLHTSGETARPGDAVCPEEHARPDAAALPDGTVLHVDPAWAAEQAMAEQLVFADDLTDDEVRALMRECEIAWGIPA